MCITVKVRMPFGSFTLKDDREKLAFLSGGIGITPLRSMAKYIVDMKLPTDVVLLYGNRSAEEIVFKEDFDTMQKTHANFRAIYTLTSAAHTCETWRGRTGYIDDVMIKEEIPDFNERIFYICGPPSMVESLKTVLREKVGAQEERIRIENFTGY